MSSSPAKCWYAVIRLQGRQHASTTTRQHYDKNTRDTSNRRRDDTTTRHDETTTRRGARMSRRHDESVTRCILPVPKTTTCDLRAVEVQNLLQLPRGSFCSPRHLPNAASMQSNHAEKGSVRFWGGVEKQLVVQLVSVVLLSRGEQSFTL